MAVILILAGIGVMSAVLVANEVLKREFVAHIRMEWIQQAGTVTLAPVGAMYYGTQLKRNHTNYSGQFGALGISDKQLVFRARNGDRVVIPLSDIAWAGIHYIRVKRGKHTRRSTAVMVHSVCDGRYDVGAWVVQQPWRIVATLEPHIGDKVRTFGTHREDRGPMQAVRVQQDIYGQWEEVPSPHGDLYLAPDRLVIGRREWILFSQLRRVDVYEKDNLLHQLNPLAKDLLRIEYETAEGERAVTGFFVRDADGWAEKINEIAWVPVDVHTGRKKKPSRE